MTKGEDSIRELDNELKTVNQEADGLQKRQKQVEEQLKQKKDACGKAKVQ